MSEDKLHKARVIIHGSAATAASCSAVAAAIPIVGPVTGDSASLVGITCTMCSLLSRNVFHRDLDESKWTGAVLAGFQFFHGAVAIKIVASLIPVFGSAVNASVSAKTVEAIGWGVYHMLDEGKTPDDMIKEYLEKYWQLGKRMTNS